MHIHRSGSSNGPVSQPARQVEVIGHRGDVLNHIENTIPSLRAGWAKGDAVEVDVQMTRDGKLVLFHDDFLGRHGFHMPNEETQRLVGDYSSQQLREEVRFNQAGWEEHMSGLRGEPIRYKLENTAIIPTLDELLPIPGDKKIYFEIKRPHNWRPCFDDLEKKLVDWIREHKLEDRSVVISFNPWSLLKVKTYAPELKLGLDDEHSYHSPFRGPLLWLSKKILKLDYLIPDAMQTTRRLVRRCHKLGLKIVPYMPIGGYAQQKDPGRNTELKVMKRLIDMGVDGIVTNQPQALKELIG